MAQVLCPRCNEQLGVPIAHGMPGPDMVESASRGEVVLGGCCIDTDSPTHRCKACGHEWIAERVTLSHG